MILIESNEWPRLETEVSDGGLKIRVEHVLTSLTSKSWMRSTYRTIPDLKDHENSLLKTLRSRPEDKDTSSFRNFVHI